MNGVIEELRAYPRTDLTPGQVAMIRDTITAVQIQIASIREEAERAVLALFPPAATTSTRAATSAQQAVTPASDLCARILEVFKQALQILMNCISYLFAAVTSAPPPQTGAASQEVSSDCIRV
ncbi:MAG: hypothetical protein KGQ49_02385 [Verrucomicrobia bacterium]|nr:hypothetical protein [Verrucomicrobiota bacterium]MDE3046946.1 hypothetical protein [Verrucomicrobiota bacterium]